MHKGTRLEIVRGKKKKHDSVMEISAQSQEHFPKSLSMNTVHCAVHEHGLEL